MKILKLRDLKPGYQVLLDDEFRKVVSIEYGNGLTFLNGKTSKPVLVKFESGDPISHHPDSTVKVRR